MKKTIYTTLCILLGQLLIAQEKNLPKASASLSHIALVSSISIYTSGMTACESQLISLVDRNEVKSYINRTTNSMKINSDCFRNKFILEKSNHQKSWNFIYRATDNYEDGGTFNKRVYGINYDRGKVFSIATNYSLHTSWSLGLGTMNVNLPTETDLSLMHTLSSIAANPTMLIQPYTAAGSFLYPVIGCNIKIQKLI